MKRIERRPLMDATATFFDELGARGHEPLLEKATGKFRFELTNGRRKERWLVTVEKGDITVSHANARADCVIRTDRGLFERLVTGEENAMAAMLRGAVGVEGRPELLVLFQRILPAPPSSGKRS